MAALVILARQAQGPLGLLARLVRAALPGLQGRRVTLDRQGPVLLAPPVTQDQLAIQALVSQGQLGRQGHLGRLALRVRLLLWGQTHQEILQTIHKNHHRVCSS